MNDDIEDVRETGPTGDRQEHTGPGRRAIDEFDGVAEAVVFAVSAVTGTAPTELEPLYGVVDVDALENLFAPKADGTPRSGGIVRFTYCGCEVTVRGSERVLVELNE